MRKNFDKHWYAWAMVLPTVIVLGVLVFYPLVRGVLHDLTENGLVFSSGSGQDQVYRATTKAEHVQMSRLADASGLDELLWAFIYREGPVTRAALAELAAGNPAALDAVLQRLIELGKITAAGEGGARMFRAEKLEVLLDAEVGWEAAVFDHYRALVQTICQRLTSANKSAQASSRTGGSTFTLDVWPVHPHADEAYGVLARFRALHTELYERIERYNEKHGRPAEYDQVVIYGGQHVRAHQEEEKS